MLRDNPTKGSEFPEIWFRGLKEKEKEDLLNALRYSPLTKRMTEIIESFIQEVSVPSRKDYDNPSWAFKQAHFNGESLAYDKILKILRPKEN